MCVYFKKMLIQNHYLDKKPDGEFLSDIHLVHMEFDMTRSSLEETQCKCLSSDAPKYISYHHSQRLFFADFP